MTSVFTKDALKGKVALITGGGTGINFGIARTLGSHGCIIAITGRRKEVLEKATSLLTKEGITSFGIPGDVRKYDDCKKAANDTVTKYGRIDILVNGAAGNFLCAAEDLTPNGFRTVMEIDAFGTFNMVQACFEALKASKGVIINISATLHYTATHYQLHASAAKASVDAMTRNLAVEWGKYGIRTVGIAPGPIADTEGMTRLSGGGEDERLKLLEKTIPLRRMGFVTDIGQTALFLSSPAASYINGQTIVVDGGSCLYIPPFVPEDMYAVIAAQRKSKL